MGVLTTSFGVSYYLSHLGLQKNMVQFQISIIEFKSFSMALIDLQIKESLNELFFSMYCTQGANPLLIHL